MLAPGPAVAASSVARAIGQALGEPMASDHPPVWLDEGQAASFRRLLHLLRRYGVGLCADPVGSGKTYIALAVAQALDAGAPCCIAPPTILGQWQDVARRLGVPLVPWSHARLSRGMVPPGNPHLIIVDESHHFRNPTTRRYRTLAPWLIGRTLLLLSATPVVNSTRDLFHQLHLGLRDDVLASDGHPSLRAEFAGRSVPAALGRHVVERWSAAGRPRSLASEVTLASGAAVMAPDLDRLRISDAPPIATLVRSVLLLAAASSAAALHGALCRYRRLLLHARDAAEAGHAVTRRGLRALLVSAGEQVELWPLLSPDSAGDALRLDEVPELDRLVALLRPRTEEEDDKAAWLRQLLEDRVPTLVFVSRIETAHYLRRLLAEPWLAWCTGRTSGIGRIAVPRGDVLRWFRPGAPDTWGRPRTLIATDVGAEGLDLQRAERVVHYDLPWTEVRLAQRDGRAVRRGSAVSEVVVWRIRPSEATEARLHQEAILLRKSGLPAGCGLGSAGRSRWRWRQEVAAEAAGPAREGVGAIRAAEAGWLAGIAIERNHERLAVVVLWRGATGEWVEDPEAVEGRLLEAMAAPHAAPPATAEVALMVAELGPRILGMVRDASRYRRVGVEPGPAARALGRKLRHLAAAAARDRARARLAQIERALAFTTGGHTAGEEALVLEISRLPIEELLHRLPSLPVATPPLGPAIPRLVGLIEFVARSASKP